MRLVARMTTSCRSPVPPAGETFALLRAGFLAIVATVMLTSCAYVPVAVDGVSTRPDLAAREGENPWVFVPAGAWITRDTVRPVSVGMCAAPACPERIAVAVVEARGVEARTLARSLRQPAGLVTRLVEGNRRRIALVAQANRTVSPEVAARRTPQPVAAHTRPFRHRALSGFTMEMRRASGATRTAHAAVLGRQAGGVLKVVIVIGEKREQVEAAARTVADANL
jgi:hypothetical protein